MYIDDSVVAGLLIIVLTCGVLAYVGHFAYKHIKEDIRKNKA